MSTAQALDLHAISVEYEGSSWTLYKDDSRPYIRDLDWAERLGYERPRDIRELIRRLASEGRLGVCRTVRQTSGALGGRPATEYYLTEGQALKVAAKSETDYADAILDQIIAVFFAVRDGARGPQKGGMGSGIDLGALIRKELTAAVQEEVRAAVRQHIQGAGTMSVSMDMADASMPPCWPEMAKGLRQVGVQLGRETFTAAEVVSAARAGGNELHAMRKTLQELQIEGSRASRTLGYYLRRAHQRGLLTLDGTLHGCTLWRLPQLATDVW